MGWLCRDWTIKIRASYQSRSDCQHCGTHRERSSTIKCKRERWQGIPQHRSFVQGHVGASVARATEPGSTRKPWLAFHWRQSCTKHVRIVRPIQPKGRGQEQRQRRKEPFPKGRKVSLNKRVGIIPGKVRGPTTIGVPIEAGEVQKVDDIVKTACHIVQLVCMELVSKLHTNCNVIIQTTTMTRSVNFSTARKMTNGSFVGVGRWDYIIEENAWRVAPAFDFERMLKSTS